MCAIAGFLETGRARADRESILLGMLENVHHRGPDFGGSWLYPHSGVALGHRQLAILDLSPDGNQPMHCRCGRFVITFNGEIYNYKPLRSELESQGRLFKTASDTEVMLEAICAWGVAKTLQRMIGMFAFAVWDTAERCLFLARDRMGEKPLYYGRVGDTLLFASELKAFRAYPEFRGEIDRNVLALYLRHGYIPGAYCIYRGFHKLPAGTYLKIVQSERLVIPEPVAYWSIVQAAEAGVADPWTGSDSEAIDFLERMVSQVIQDQMQSDVPLGAFLSGGIDSSLVVSLMQAQSSRPIRTFTIGFWDPARNEAENAKAIAKHLGTEHTELYVSGEDAMGVIPLLPRLYDEPFADSTQIPTYLVAHLARAHVTVSLSGDGADELFSGYKTYPLAQRLWRLFGQNPAGVKAVEIASRACERVGDSLASWAPDFTPPSRSLNRLRKLAELLPVGSQEELYLRLTSACLIPERMVLGAVEPESPLRCAMRAAVPGFLERMMLADALVYIPDDILVKLDRAAMGVSLETRVPLIDKRIVEFSWRLPEKLRVHDGKGKWILRQILSRHVPQDLFEGPKKGFSVPLGEWLRGPLRDWAGDLLSESRLTRQGFFDPGSVQKKWADHLKGRFQWQTTLWAILMFQAWLDEFHVGEFTSGPKSPRLPGL